MDHNCPQMAHAGDARVSVLYKIRIGTCRSITFRPLLTMSEHAPEQPGPINDGEEYVAIVASAVESARLTVTVIDSDEQWLGEWSYRTDVKGPDCQETLNYIWAQTSCECSLIETAHLTIDELNAPQTAIRRHGCSSWSSPSPLLGLRIFVIGITTSPSSVGIMTRYSSACRC